MPNEDWKFSSSVRTIRSIQGHLNIVVGVLVVAKVVKVSDGFILEALQGQEPGLFYSEEEAVGYCKTLVRGS